MENTGLRKIVEPTSREERVGGNGKKTEMVRRRKWKNRQKQIMIRENYDNDF